MKNNHVWHYIILKFALELKLEVDEVYTSIMTMILSVGLKVLQREQTGDEPDVPV